MIHYTLIPPEEMRALRREYRMRLCIVISFFVSCGVVLGIISLIPAYLYSRAQESEVALRTEKLQEGRKASGIVQIEKDLSQSQAIAEQITAEMDQIVHSDSIARVVALRPQQVLISSFAFSRASGTTTPYEIIVQGKAPTREVLIAFEKELKESPAFSKVDLPLSDLVKSKNISFALKLSLKK